MRRMRADNVILIGFMGAGKSAVGRLLARRLGRCFVETDDMIVARVGRPIPEIFRVEGEERFRELEADALDALKLKSGDVIATGGGLPCREGRMEALRALGTVVWLAGDFADLYERARRSADRPIHADYIAVGADLIETNTFGANRFKLALHGLAGQVREINGRGVRVARDARESTGRDVLVLGSIGPLGKYLAPLGSVTAEEARAAFREQAEGLLEGGVGERLIYLSSPAYMAEYATRMVDAGARIVGGCCGTTPQHIAAMREALDRKSPIRRESVRPTITVSAPAVSESAGLVTRRPATTLQRKLEARELVVTVELDPPRGHTVEKLVQGAKLLKERGVEIVDINDGSLGRVRMAVLPTALLVREATGLDINMHFTCRDRNLMGIQADLLGAHALDVRNILALRGDPPRAGDYVNTTAVFDVNAIGLIEVLKRMNQGLDATGNTIGVPTSFCIGAALNPGAENIKGEIGRFHRKVHAGAQWVQTQPVYDLAELDRFLEQAGGSPVPVIVGVLPLHSYRHAEFLHNEVPGITIPDPIRARLRDAGDGALQIGIEMAQRLVCEIRGRYAGLYLVPSFGRFEVVAEVLDALH